MEISIEIRGADEMKRNEAEKLIKILKINKTNKNRR